MEFLFVTQCRAFEVVQLNEYVTEARKPLLIMHPGLTSDKEYREHQNIKDTQRQFSENTCSEDDLRSRIFGTFVVKFLACLPLLGFSNFLKKV